MQKDCHYYGTFYMAWCAGFSPEDAQKIAWAAQSVDQMDFDTVRNLRKQHNCPDINMVTIEAKIESVNDVLRNGWSDQNKYLTLIRNIWVPFHFLPGLELDQYNLRLKQAYDTFDKNYLVNLKKIKWNDNANYDRNKQDFSLICAPSSGLCKDMIMNAKEKYDWYRYRSVIDKISALYYIGICMHVLADTWSHQDFCGSFNQMVNTGTFLNENCDLGREVGLMLQVTSDVSPFSPAWTGHGSAGSNPDIPGKTYYYKPVYKVNEGITDDVKDVKQKEFQEKKFEVKNAERFSNGFLQMYDALYDIHERMFDKSWFEFRVVFGDKSKERPRINSGQLIYGIIGEIREKLFKDIESEKERCKMWKDYLNEKHSSDFTLKDYNIEDGDFVKFMKVAREHRRFIMEKVSTSKLLAGGYNETIVDKYFKEEL